MHWKHQLASCRNTSQHSFRLLTGPASHVCVLLMRRLQCSAGCKQGHTITDAGQVQRCLAQGSQGCKAKKGGCLIYALQCILFNCKSVAELEYNALLLAQHANWYSRICGMLLLMVYLVWTDLHTPKAPVAYRNCPAICSALMRQYASGIITLFGPHPL